VKSARRSSEPQPIPTSLKEDEDYAKLLSEQVAEWEAHPEVYERWLRECELSEGFRKLRAIKCEIMGFPYSDLDFE
jgi:hypothetical protein